MNSDHLARAQKRVKKIKSFYKNLITWAVFSFFFIVLNVLGGAHFPWAIFPIGGWGISVIIQAIDVFGLPGYGVDWEKRILEEEMRKLDMEEKLKQRYLSLKTKEKTEKLEEEEQLDLEELSKIKKGWDDSELV